MESQLNLHNKIIEKSKKKNKAFMLLVLFALFNILIGMAICSTYSGFQSASQSSGTLTFAVNGHQGDFSLSNTKVSHYNSNDLTLGFTLVSDTNYTTPTISGITMDSVPLTKDGNNFKNDTIVVATYSAPTLTIYRAEVTGDLVISGSSTAQTYTITYNSNGGTGTMTASTPSYGSDFTLSTNTFTRTGYTFWGWATSSNGNAIYYDSAPVKDLGDTTLFAVWSGNEYLINFDGQGADNIGTIAIIVSYGSALPSITVPTRTGYLFAGYYTAINGGGTQYYTSSGTSAMNYNQTNNITLYANWEIDNHTVTYNATTNGGTTSATTDTVNHNGSADLTKTATKTNWTFVGWNTSSSATTALGSYTVTTNVTLYAIFSRTLTMNYNNNGTTGSVSTTIYNTATSGTSTTNLPAIANRGGWTINGWSSSTTANNSVVDSNANAHTITITTSNTGGTYYATYYRTLTLSYNANGGSSTPNSQSTTQFYNSAGNTSSYTFTLANGIARASSAQYDYSFNKWAAGSTSGTQYNAGAQVTISADTAFWAIWNSSVRNYTVTLTGNIYWVAGGYWDPYDGGVDSEINETFTVPYGTVWWANYNGDSNTDGGFYLGSFYSHVGWDWHTEYIYINDVRHEYPNNLSDTITGNTTIRLSGLVYET